MEADDTEFDGPDEQSGSLDRRSLRQRARAQQSPVGDIEGMARRIVSAVTGVPVEIQDNGSGHATVDLRIHYPQRPPGFVEVVTKMDPAYAAMWRRVINHDATLDAPALNRVWRLSVTPQCNINNLSSEAPNLLMDLTVAGETFDHHVEFAAAPHHPHPAVRRLAELGVVSMESRATKAGEPGQIRLDPLPITGPMEVNWPPILAWVGLILASEALEDVRTKLAATAAPERHVFLGITQSCPGEVFFALTHRQSAVPAENPRLPTEITHLWIANVDMIGRCLAWFPDRGWFDTMHR